MKKAIANLTWILFISIFNSVYAQNPEDLTKWNIQQCLKYASDHNIQINTLRLSQQSSLQDLSLARAVKIPSLSASLGNTFINGNNETASGNLINQLTTSGSYSINSSITLWNDNFINNNIRQKDLLVETAGLSVQQSINNITLQITQAYLDILLSKENEKYIKDLVGTSEARLKQSQMFYDAGSIAKKDLLQLKAQYASDQYLLIQTQNAIRQNILTLKQILQIPSDSLADIVVPDSLEVVKIVPALQRAQQEALMHFPEIKIGELALDIAELDIEKARAGFKPILKASGALGSGYSDILTNYGLSRTGYFSQVGNNFYQQAGLVLSIPIFSNRINRTNLEKSNIAYLQAQLNLQNERLVLSQAVEQAYLRVVNAQQSYEAAQEQLLAATESYRIVNEQIKLGAINAYDLLQQRNQYVQALQAFTLAKYTAFLQLKIYEFYMGKPVIF